MLSYNRPSSSKAVLALMHYMDEVLSSTLADMAHKLLRVPVHAFLLATTNLHACLQ